ncbi:ABC transporter ATP-binding protein [Methylobacterium gnaphalii]|uniref:Multidrug ABC transporter ATP-binding protein n=1 Tax=Methylobacterium gnaphalii TaxID=1010610 RepID=A0A512JHM8_9HYPH|nr:ABC transporter ATP-binding protein [Methylobacterium gnaphalii]GEP09471.1 multidrug ABC transporter ATP-binding protein [Methylobacterium gnaphalii]GJD68051.1 Vitamin B12 import ATP-binding protein BtuD [Methylobacterium gnaphalii]
MRDAALAYHGRPALDGVSLCVMGGETLALLGPNGAGKTSLMRLAAGRLRPGSGTVRVMGGDPARDSATRRHIGFVPQDIALYPRLTVAENLDVFARLAGLGRAARRAAVATVLDQAAIEDVADRPVGALSGGYQRRVNLAASLVGRPGLILLDEPTQGVDLAARAAIHAVLSALRSQGAAIVISTHDFGEAERLADRVAFLSAGRLVREGRLADLLRPLAASLECEAMLDAPPKPPAEAALRRTGFTPGEASDATSWRAVRDAAGGVDGAAVLSALREASVPVAEIRIRRPGLEAVYRDIIPSDGAIP